MTSQTLSINFEQCQYSERSTCSDNLKAKKDYFDGKELMLLINSETLDFSQKQIKEVKKESKLYWLPISTDFRVTTRISYQRFEYQPEEDHFAKMFGKQEASLSGVSVLNDEKHWMRYQYQFSELRP